MLLQTIPIPTPLLFSQRCDSYPPNAYKLFFDDHLRKEKLRQLTLQQQQEHQQQRMSNSLHTSQVTTIAAVATSESLSSSFIQNDEESPQPLRRRTPTKFTLFIQKVTKLWNEISIEEKQIWEQRAEIAVAILQERSGENSRTPSQSCTVSSTQQLMVNQQ
jgi:hypothetical protein